MKLILHQYEVVVADLRQFNELLDGFRTEAASLVKKADDLKQECTTLDARKKFLSVSISELTIEKEQKVVSLGKKIAQQEFDITESKDYIIELNNNIRNLRKDKQQLEIGNQSLEDKCESESKRIQVELDAKQKDLNDLQKQYDDKYAQFIEYSNKVKDLIDQSAGLEQQVILKKEEVTKQLTELSKQGEDALNQSEIIKDRLESITTEFSIATKNLAEVKDTIENDKQQHDIFRQYEIKARKKLEARETSLNEREELLADAIKRAKRSGIILDTV